MFPPVESADEDGVVAIGGHPTPWALISAYSQGIFPWPHQDYPFLWFAPPERGVLFFDELHVGSRLRRYLKKEGFQIRFNTAFEQVLDECAAPRWYEGEWEEETWITPEIKEGYCQLHQMGFAHSVEAWQDDVLVGGLYGINLGLYFSGESMFTRRDNASKACVLGLIECLRRSGGWWLDCQTLTPHFQKLGARSISRQQFMLMHREAAHQNIRPFAWCASAKQERKSNPEAPPESSE